MAVHSGFEVPRFVALLGHFVLLVVFLWDAESVARSSLPWSQRHESDLVESTQNSVIVALAIATALVSIEITCFMIGTSLFFPRQSLFSAAAHTLCFISLAHFMVERFQLGYYWVLLAVTAASCVSELAILFGAFVLNKPL